MAILQIKKLKAPDKIRRSSLNTTGTESNSVTENSGYNVDDDGVFTCYFSRPVATEDFPQAAAGTTPSIAITVAVYGADGASLCEMTLNVTQANIRGNDHICFKLSMSDNDFQSLSGSSIYVHARMDHVIAATTNNAAVAEQPENNNGAGPDIDGVNPDPDTRAGTNTQAGRVNPANRDDNVDANTNNRQADGTNANNANTLTVQNIGFRGGSVDNYHETIKNVHIYDNESIDSICWSAQRDIPASGTSTSCESRALNEDVYIHIQATGMWMARVPLVVYERGSDTLVATISAPLHKNRKVVVISMKYLLVCYCNKTDTTYSENDFVDLNFYIKTDFLPRITPIPFGPIAVSAQQPSLFGNENTGTVTQPSLGTEGTVANQQAEDPLQRESADLHLTGSIGDQSRNTENVGNAIFRVGKGEVAAIGSERYRDFQIGYMCHIEGVGKLVNYLSNAADNTPKLTVYPFHAYKIMLSDLVACGLVKLEEAIYLTTENHGMQTLKSLNTLENNFDKAEANNLAADKSLISIFQNGTATNRDNIRKLLTQVQSVHEDEFLQDENLIGQRFICRDAWQKRKADGRIYKRANDHRYSYAKECPYGEYFLNWVAGTFRIYVSRSLSGSTIDVTGDSPNRMQRTGIAFHKGTSGKSIGCITFNSDFAYRYSDFENKLFPTSRVSGYVDTNSNHNATRGKRMLNLLCIDERHAIGQDPDSSNSSIERTAILHNDSAETIGRGSSVPFWRYYDLIEPDDTMVTVMQI